MGTLKALKCIKSDRAWWTVGKEYIINSKGVIFDDDVSFRRAEHILDDYTEGRGDSLDFEPIYEEPETADKLKALKCIKSNVPWWTEGKEYEVDSEGFIIDEMAMLFGAEVILEDFTENKNCHVNFVPIYHEEESPSNVSDGSTASYYELPDNATELQHLISHKNMNAQLGEIFRECYRYGIASHCDELRGINKILFYANAEKERLEKLNADN